MKKQQTGFTLVELVVVIVILGILAATAMPKFMNVTASAHSSAVAGLGGSFGSAVNLVKATWVAGGNTAAVQNLSGYGTGTASIDTNVSGWIIGTDNAFADSADCVNIWDALMQNPPTVSSAAGSDYRAAYATGVCTYTYQADTGKNVAYAPATGAVVVTN